MQKVCPFYVCTKPPFISQAEHCKECPTWELTFLLDTSNYSHAGSFKSFTRLNASTIDRVFSSPNPLPLFIQDYFIKNIILIINTTHWAPIHYLFGGSIRLHHCLVPVRDTFSRARGRGRDHGFRDGSNH